MYMDKISTIDQTINMIITHKNGVCYRGCIWVLGKPLLLLLKVFKIRLLKVDTLCEAIPSCVSLHRQNYCLSKN